MAKFRLRFLTQELDLAEGATYVGRSAECEITIEDPLVSRKHARLVVESESATLTDLGSRNGVKLNGAPIREPTSLRDGDRLRIGMHELVFCRVDAGARDASRTTGALRHCARCRLPYPSESPACPNCGTAEPADDETLGGAALRRSSASAQMLIDVLEKAVSIGRFSDAERILRRATGFVDEGLAANEQVDARQLRAIAAAATRIAVETNDPSWGLWAANVHRVARIIPPADMCQQLVELARQHPSVADALDGLRLECRKLAHPLSLAEQETMALLDACAR